MLYDKGKLDCQPSEVGYDESREEVLIRHFEKMMEQKKIQCASYCVSRKGKIIMNGAVGPRSYEEGCTEPLAADSVHRIASVTKTFCAVAIMQLVENGYFRLDTPVGTILPQFNTPPYDEITIFHLITHTSGLRADENVFEDKYEVSPWDYIGAYAEMHKSNDFDWLAEALHCGLTKPVGAEWQYCSFGFVVLGAVIEKVTGMKAYKYIEENICKPLHMDQSRFFITQDMAKKAIYRDEKSKKVLQQIEKGEEVPDEDEGTIWEKIPPTGGFLASSSRDLVRYGNMLLNKGRLDGVRILGRKSVEKMTTIALHNIPDHCWGSCNGDREYGIGFDMRTGIPWIYSDGTFMHEGAGACAMIIDPVEEMVAAWFVPFLDEEWHDDCLWNVTNIIWSGLI